MSIDKNTNEGKNYRNNVVKSTLGTSKSRINTGFPEDISVLSPMMKEYIKTKEEYNDCILFYRLGDFYEMFFEDALTASRELQEKTADWKRERPCVAFLFMLRKLISTG